LSNRNRSTSPIARDAAADLAAEALLDLYVDPELPPARAVGNLGQQVDLAAFALGQLVKHLLVQEGETSRTEVPGQASREAGNGKEQQIGEKGAKQILPQLVVAGHSGTYLLPLQRRETPRWTLQFGSAIFKVSRYRRSGRPSPAVSAGGRSAVGPSWCSAVPGKSPQRSASDSNV
jgi:hypothetical protein